MDELAAELIVIVLFGVAMWAAIVFFIPSCTASLFRYRMWEIRDAIVDDVFDDRFPDHPAVWEVVDRVEALIVIARHLSMGKLIAFSRALRNVAPEPMPSRATLTPEQRHRLHEYEHDMQRGLAVYLTAGTPTGWVLFPFFIAYVVASELPGFLFKPKKPRRPTSSAAHAVERRVAAPVVNRPDFWEETLLGGAPRGEGVLTGSV